MIDRICYWFFGKLDDLGKKLDNAFIVFPTEKKHKKKNGRANR